MKVNEIFKSIEGEGIRAGIPAVFIRLTGCNLRCSYCDTTYAFDEGEEMAVEEIIKVVKEYDVDNVTLTGGEPLAHPNVLQLLSELCRAEFQVNVETNGSIDIKAVRDYLVRSVGAMNARNCFFTIDYKCPSSGMESLMNIANFQCTIKDDVLKFVVGSEEDLNAMKNVVEKYRPKATVYASPVFGEIEPKRIVEFILENKLYNIRTQLQIHKFIWEPNKRGV